MIAHTKKFRKDFFISENRLKIKALNRSFLGKKNNGFNFIVIKKIANCAIRILAALARRGGAALAC
jgi:hypothetical protein